MILIREEGKSMMIPDQSVLPPPSPFRPTHTLRGVAGPGKTMPTMALQLPAGGALAAIEVTAVMAVGMTIDLWGATTKITRAAAKDPTVLPSLQR